MEEEQKEQVVEETAVETPATPNEDTQVSTDETFTKERVNEIVRERVNKTHERTLARYGVNSYDELDGLLEEGKRLKEQFNSVSLKNGELFKENLYLKNNIDPVRYKDIEAHCKGAEVELNEETLAELLKTHPEWLKKPEIQVKSVGVEKKPIEVETERAQIERLFG